MKLTWIIVTILFPALAYAGMGNVCNRKRSEKPGNCNYKTVWSYDMALDECLSWTSSGCNVEGNMFATYADCRYQCVRTPTTVAWIKDHRCNLDIVESVDNNNCQYEHFWSYDRNQKKCIYRKQKGCAIIGNMFTQLADCLDNCEPTAYVDPTSYVENLEICQFPISSEIVRTRCENGTELFSYNQDTQQCDKWKYYGCEIRGNKFVSLEDCKNKCTRF